MPIKLKFLLPILFVCNLTGCNSVPSPTSKPDADGGLQAKEAPMLAKLVAAGKLPPLEQRMPANPLVVKPYEALGFYGGTWHVMVDNPDLGMYKMMNGYAPLVRWKADCSGLEPGTASSWEFNKDGSQLTLHLRKGIKWSDGVEFTSANSASPSRFGHLSTAKRWSSKPLISIQSS